MDTTNAVQPSPEAKHCWICFLTEDDYEDVEGNNDWVAPCKCRGSTQWVHQYCLQLWINEKLKDRNYVTESCPLCRTNYIIVYKELNIFVRFLNEFDKCINLCTPFCSAGIMITAFYWTTTTYGIIAVIQVMGEQNALKMLNNTDSCMLILLLPLVPVGLIAGNMINWEETLLCSVHRLISQQSLFGSFIPSFLRESTNRSSSAIRFNTFSTITIITALLFPNIASTIGNLLFNNKYSHSKKTLLGGLLYIAIKGALKIYQKQHNFMRMKNRQIINYVSSDDEGNP